MTVKKRTILISPLDWGLGHATRCIPIIKELLKNNCTVIIGGSGNAGELLKKEFPQLIYEEAPATKIRYSKSAAGFIWALLKQIPQAITQYKLEKKWLQEIINKHEINAIISDNRYGLYNQKISAVIITHQICIKTGLGKYVDGLFNRLVTYKLLEKFQAVWIPDNKENPTMGGELSHPTVAPHVPLIYLGILNRFSQVDAVVSKTKKILVLLSGPEPQRTLLENKMIQQLPSLNWQVDVVRGLPASAQTIENLNAVHFYNHLDTERLFEKIKEAELIITRSGYTSLMELLPLNKKCIFIPTPGQTEQQYLAQLQQNNGRALCFNQEDFNVEKAISQGEKHSFQLEEKWPNSQLPFIIKNWLENIKA
jgi:spore coat polysaccharide biosynthesis predicted glycosyltransferase SpsG